MSNLREKLPIPEKALQLLEAIDCTDIAALAAQEEESFLASLIAANQEAKIYKKPPSRAMVAEWIEAAKKAVLDDAPLVNFEFDPDVVEMIAFSPVALPLPGKLLAAKGVSVHDIPEAVLLTAARGDVSIRVGVTAPEKVEESAPVKTPVGTGGYVNSISFSQKKEEVNLSKLRSTAEFLDPDAKPLIDDQKNRAEERMRLMRSALVETNKGIDPSSRRYIRGVLHTHPKHIWWGALLTLICLFFIPTGIMGAFALLLKDQKHPAFQWVPHWFLAFPLGVFVFGLLYLMISYNASCRICGQKCFVPRKCLKNSKAHHIPVLGYVFSCALHILLFRWFRCTYCGTPVRLKQ